MSETVLQTYLNAQHIKTSDETNISNLKKAITEVKKLLEKKKEKVIPYVLVALDPKVSGDDPVVVEVEKIIIKKWSTFKNNTSTKDKPTTYIRAVILSSLSDLVKKDESYAALVWHTSRDIISHYQIGKEKDELLLLVQNTANIVEKSARNLWSIDDTVEVPSFDLNFEIETKVVAKKYLTERLKAAAGPSRVENGTNVSNENANRYWSNSNQNWVTDFGDKAGEAISTSVNSVLSSQNKQISGLASSLQAEIKEFINSLALSVLNSNLSVKKRNNLLWWKEALYSQSINKSYRENSVIENSILLPLDLAESVDSIYPISVDFLLKETLRDVHGEEINSKVTLTEVLKNIKSINEPIKEHLKGSTRNEEYRKPLITGFANSINEEIEEDFFKQTGIDKKAEVSFADLAVWIFHGLQAEKIATAK